MKYLFTIVLTFVFLISCARGFRTKQLVYSTPSTAFYELERDQVPNKQLIEGKLIHPQKIEPEKIADIIGNLKFTKSTRINTFDGFIFHEKELPQLSEDISLALENLNDKKIMIVISQYDHMKSVVSTYKRTSFYLWINAEGLNIVFGDVQGDLAREDSSNFFDWNQIEPITLKQRPDENEITLDKEIFSFKKINGFYNHKWLVFSLEDMEKYKLNRAGATVPAN